MVYMSLVQADFADLDWQHVNAGDTPMHLAAATGNIEAIRILLKSHVSAPAQLHVAWVVWACLQPWR